MAEAATKSPVKTGEKAPALAAALQAGWPFESLRREIVACSTISVEASGASPSAAPPSLSSLFGGANGLGAPNRP